MDAKTNRQDSFADDEILHQQWLQGELLTRHLSYCREQLGNNFPVLTSLADHARPPGQTFKGKTHPLVLPISLSEGLKTLSRTADVTLFMTLLAGFQVLLHRHTAHDKIVLAVPIRMAGGFPNTLLLRTDTSGDPTFLELLHRIREVVLRACAHAELPFEQLIAELQPSQGESRNPSLLCPVLFAMKHTQIAADGAEDFISGDPHDGTANIDLALVMEDAVQGLRGSFQFNARLFEDATIARMAGHLEMLLSGVIANPERRLSMLPLLTGEERHQLLVGWNDTGTDYPSDSCLHQLFEANEKKSPDAVALIFTEAQVTYSELNRRANQLAQRLRSLGVGPEARVGICVERSVEMVVAILGALKAGGAYVPLDPTYPRERLAFMLEDVK
ncbi:MAG: condensation domain-containing protein, partial [Candidatus Binatia bacterium]